MQFKAIFEIIKINKKFQVVEEQLCDEDSDDIYTLSRVADVIHALFLSYKATFIPYFDQVCGHFVKLLNPDGPWSDRQWGLCIFDDAIEFAGPLCSKYQEFFLAPMLQFLSDNSAEVRQAAAYGCGVLGQVLYIFVIGFLQVCAENCMILILIYFSLVENNLAKPVLKQFLG